MTKSAQSRTGLNCFNFIDALEKENSNFLKEFPNTKLGKQIKFINMLAYDQPKTIDRLADLMGKSTKQIGRDLKALEAFFVIDFKDKKPFICVDPTNGRYKQMNITKSEAKHLIQHLLGSNQSLSRSLAHKLSFYLDEELINFTKEVNLPEKIDTAEDAIKENIRIKLINYHSSNSGNMKNRQLEPISIEAGVYLVAYDIEAKRTKIFHLDRADKVELLKNQYIENEEMHQYLKPDPFLMFGLNPAPIELLLTSRAANILKEQYPVAASHLREERHLEQIKYRLEVEINDYHGVGRFISGLLHDVKIVKNDDLKNYLLDYINSGINRFQKVS